MAIDTKRLRYFVQVADSGSLIKAAEELHVAQPALSRQIHLLEDYLGFPLFVRTGRGMSLTQEGSYLRDAIAGPMRNIELAVENMRSFISRAADFSVGIGIHSAVSRTLTVPLIGQLEAAVPGVRLRVMEGTSAGLYSGLKHGVLDYVVLDDTFQSDSLVFRQLTSENLVLLGNFSTLHTNKAPTLAELAQLPLIAPCTHQSARRLLDNAVNQAKLNLHIILETDSPGLIYDQVTHSRGVALVHQSLATHLCQQDASLTFRDLDPALTTGTYLATRGLGEISGSTTTTIEQTITQCVKELLTPAL